MLCLVALSIGKNLLCPCYPLPPAPCGLNHCFGCTSWQVGEDCLRLLKWTLSDRFIEVFGPSLSSHVVDSKALRASVNLGNCPLADLRQGKENMISLILYQYLTNIFFYLLPFTFYHVIRDISRVMDSFPQAQKMKPLDTP